MNGMTEAERKEYDEGCATSFYCTGDKPPGFPGVGAIPFKNVCTEIARIVNERFGNMLKSEWTAEHVELAMGELKQETSLEEWRIFQSYPLDRKASTLFWFVYARNTPNIWRGGLITELMSRGGMK